MKHIIKSYISSIMAYEQVVYACKAAFERAI